MNYDDFAPIGGCSRAQHEAVAAVFYRDFTEALLAAIAEVPLLTPYDLTPESIRPNGPGHPRVHWEDRKDLAYYVSSTLQHNMYKPAHMARACLSAHYAPENYADDCYPISEWLEPPLSFNVQAQADMLVGALKRHRREVLGR